jgi:glycerophosphoryl diester phosphodiesterase
MADMTLAILDKAGATSRVMLESFDWRCLQHVRAIRPDVRLGWLTRASLGPATHLWWNGFSPEDHAGSVPRAVAAQGATTWAPDHRDLTQEQIEEANDLGMRVIAWTVNNPADMRRLIDWGIDGIISDRPDLVKSPLQPASR